MEGGYTRTPRWDAAGSGLLRRADMRVIGEIFRILRHDTAREGVGSRRQLSEILYGVALPICVRA